MIINKNIQFDHLGYYGNSNWIRTNQAIDYNLAVDWMEDTVKNIQLNNLNNTVWLLEHKSVITGGSLSKSEELINKDNIQVIQSGRGGQWTWHGPGQRVAYIMMNLNQRNKDVKKFVRDIESLIIKTLGDFNIKAFNRSNFPGVWVNSGSYGRLDKIASIGIRVSKWISYHGVSININPKLEYFNNIIPCGVKDGGVTSTSELGFNISINEFDERLAENFLKIFK
tara:strand:- start:183 stop:857 length:675 start_codon:yes stop_codon:yes gene_type:complete